MKRIVIQLSELSHENWTHIYRFIERCGGNKQYSKSDFISMKNNGISIGIDENPNDCNVCSIAEEGIIELQYETLPENEDYIFNIIYVKTDEREEFSDFTRFFLLKKKYAGRITMGINVDVLSKSVYNDYKFQLGIFLFFIKNKSPLLGKDSLYIIRKINGKLEASNIPYKKEGTKTNYNIASPFLFPLIPISRNNFSVFEQTEPNNQAIAIYIEYSLKNIKKRIEESKRKPVNLEGCNSLFEKWLVSSFYLSLDDNSIDMFEEWKSVLLEYCRNVFELIQNILYHTEEKQGLFYIVINKKERVSNTLQISIPGFTYYNNNDRFLEFGIYDYGEKGIVKTYCEKEGVLFYDGIKLIDFFRAERLGILYGTTLSKHLGIKTFVNSIKEHKGYFRVESNNPHGTKDIVTNVNVVGLLNPVCVENVFGTHYDVVLPISKIDVSENPSELTTRRIGLTSRNCLSGKLLEYGMCLPQYPIIESESLLDLYYQSFDDKEGQEDSIKTIAEKLLSEIALIDRKGVAINMKDVRLRPTILYKLIANLFETNFKQKQINDDFKLIFINLENNSIDEVCYFFNLDIRTHNKKEQCFPVILLGKKWKIQILYGKSRDEFLFANKKLHSLFFSSNYFDQAKPFYYKSTKIEKQELEKLEKIIIPYDLMIKDGNGETLFNSFVHEVLETPIENVMGCKVQFPTKIGSKLYVSNYYEADFLFHNNFFTDRFAYFIAREIVTKILNSIPDFVGKKLVLIGYNPYSSPLAERVKEYVNDYCHDTVTDIVIAKEKDREKGLEFKLSEKQINAYINDIDNYSFITIVPIASTLSTTDKIIAFFNKELEGPYRNLKLKEDPTLFPEVIEMPYRFIYNHVTILVRDKMEKTPTKIEKDKKWTSLNSHTIYTDYQKKQNGMNLDFLIQKACDNNTIQEEGNWHNLIDNHTFPEDWWKEEYINQTKNASINTKEMHGIPIASLPSLQEMKSEISFHEKKRKSFAENDVLKKYYNLSEKRLMEISKFVYFGHLKHGRNHYRYYFDIEQLFYAFSHPSILSSKNQSESSIKNRQFSLLEHWLNYLHKQLENRHNTFPIIITPDNDYESCFINAINEKVFGSNAFVVYLNINDSIQNNKYKLSYLREITKHQKTQCYFVDQVLLTGDTYHKTRSCMASILEDDDFSFDGIISVINRLSKEKYKEIQYGVRVMGRMRRLQNLRRMFSYLHFFVLPAKELEKECSLCGLQKLYEGLIDYSAIGKCRKEIDKNIHKFKIKDYDHYNKNTINAENDKIHTVDEENRYWLRMKWRHRLFFELTKFNAINCFNESFDELYNSCHTLDDKVSFLKAITFPPLSQYVKVREYAHRLQLEQLHDLLTNREHPDYDDFCMLLVLLKHLAFLGSNALVRKEVIVKSWEIYFYVVEHEKEKLIEIEKKHFTQKFVFYIKLATYKDEAKSLWLGELLRCGKEMSIIKYGNEYKAKKTTLYNPLFHVFDKTKYAIDYKDFLPLKEFKEFLSLLFYDNTAITHKTLDNFEFAIDKDNTLKEMLKVMDEDNRWRLKEFSEVSMAIEDIVRVYKKKIDQEYYYAWFRHFLNAENKTPDGIPNLEKFVYVLYERLLLTDLTDSSTKNSKPFDQNAKDLLEVAAKVMDADAAFISIKKEAKELPYVLARYNTSIRETDISNCFGTKLLQEEIDSKKKQPFVILKDLSHQGEQKLDEKGFDRATYLMLDNSEEKSKSQSTLIGVVTFLYYDKDLINAQNDWNNEKEEKKKRKAYFKVMASHDRFMKNAQESGRLLLLLKPQMDKYVRHVDDEKQFEVWKEKEKFKTKYNAMWSESDHAFKSLIEPDIENLDSYEKVPKSWYRLANIIITNLYVIFERDRNYSFEGKFFKDYALSEVLESKFEKLIEESPYWSKKEYRGCITKSKSGDNHSTIFKYDDDFDPKIIIRTNKFLLQSFIYMCVYNAFYHERNGEKTVSVAISKDNQGVFIEIVNDFPGLSQEKFNDLKTKFDNRYNPVEPDTWESIFDNYGEGITISTIRKCYKSSFHFIQKRIEDKNVFCFSSRIYPDRKE